MKYDIEWQSNALSENLHVCKCDLSWKTLALWIGTSKRRNNRCSLIIQPEFLKRWAGNLNNTGAGEFSISIRKQNMYGINSRKWRVLYSSLRNERRWNHTSAAQFEDCCFKLRASKGLRRVYAGSWEYVNGMGVPWALLSFRKRIQDA